MYDVILKLRRATDAETCIKWKMVNNQGRNEMTNLYEHNLSLQQIFMSNISLNLTQLSI